MINFGHAPLNFSRLPSLDWVVRDFVELKHEFAIVTHLVLWLTLENTLNQWHVGSSDYLIE